MMLPLLAVPIRQRTAVQAAVLIAVMPVGPAFSAVVGPLIGLPCCAHVVPSAVETIVPIAPPAKQLEVVDARDAGQRLRAVARLRRPRRSAVGRLEDDGAGAAERAGRVAGGGRRARDRVQRGRRAARLQRPRRSAVGRGDDGAGGADGHARAGGETRDAGQRRSSSRSLRPSRWRRRPCCRTVPAAPTATHVVAERQDTPVSELVVPLVCGEPGLAAVRRAQDVPLVPTATHVFASAQETAFIVCTVPPPACCVHDPPPLVVASVTPCLPAE